MLWTQEKIYTEEQFDLEADLEKAIKEVEVPLFGSSRIYLEVKKKIGLKGKTQNIPDAYLIDLTSKKKPVLFVVENELAKHHPLKHIAVQIIQFSLSFQSTPQKVKSILKEALLKNPVARKKCETYAKQHGFENIDYLLESMIYGEDAFKALVIIDELSDELETVLVSKFKFPVEVVSLQRFVDQGGNRIYQFDPFLSEIAETVEIDRGRKKGTTLTVDPSDIDTIVIPAREEGFNDVFLGENRWWSIRIHSSMILKIKYIAAYQVAPISAITHVAEVHKIERWKDTNKYVVIFEEPAKPITPIKLVPKGRVKAPQGSRYTSFDQIKNAANLDEAF